MQTSDERKHKDRKIAERKWEVEKDLNYFLGEMNGNKTSTSRQKG